MKVPPIQSLAGIDVSGHRDDELAKQLGLFGRGELVSMLYEDLSMWDALSGFVPTSLASSANKRRREFAAGRQCAYMALRQAGCAVANWPPIGQDQVPIWPHGWLGSISHTQNGAVAAVAKKDKVTLLGIDIELLQEGQAWEETRHLIVSDGELSVLSSTAIAKATCLAFSAKESLFKALYPSMRCFKEFTAARVVSFGPTNLELILTEPWGTLPQGSVFDASYVFSSGHVFTTVVR
jgi:enterobactin synthetase component D / holo-[acyl-carrier protein] synthase